MEIGIFQKIERAHNAITKYLKSAGYEEYKIKFGSLAINHLPISQIEIRGCSKEDIQEWIYFVRKNFLDIEMPSISFLKDMDADMLIEHKRRSVRIESYNLDQSLKNEHNSYLVGVDAISFKSLDKKIEFYDQIKGRLSIELIKDKKLQSSMFNIQYKGKKFSGKFTAPVTKTFQFLSDCKEFMTAEEISREIGCEQRTIYDHIHSIRTCITESGLVDVDIIESRIGKGRNQGYLLKGFIKVIEK